MHRRIVRATVVALLALAIGAAPASAAGGGERLRGRVASDGGNCAPLVVLRNLDGTKSYTVRLEGIDGSGNARIAATYGPWTNASGGELSGSIAASNWGKGGGYGIVDWRWTLLADGSPVVEKTQGNHCRA